MDDYHRNEPEEPVDACEYCDSSIYKGQTYWTDVNGKAICNRARCLAEAAREFLDRRCD